MKRTATLLIDGKPYLWRDLLKMRREQLEQCRRPDQPTLAARQSRWHWSVNQDETISSGS